jgi:5'-phosphate synthase pdxT subunit
VSRVGVLALQGAFREHRRILESLGASTRLVRDPDELAGVDALVIPGGESTTMSRLAIDLGLLEPIAERIAGGMPAFGTCAGMIMLAERVLDGRPDQHQFGGLDLTVRRNAFGRQVESFEQPVEIPAIGQPEYPGVFIRAPWVEDAGSEVEVLAVIDHPDGAQTRGLPSRGEGPTLREAQGSGAQSQGSDGPPLRQAQGSGAQAQGSDGPSLRQAQGSGAQAQGSGGPSVRIVAVRQGRVLATSFHPELTTDRRLHELFLSNLS